jgi:outer membrane protein OmpA-like peptidoglycan-associated protein/tetratricopeptide (TPR) repeat protein
MRNIIFFIVTLLLVPVISNAQRNYTSSNKKAIKSYEEALLAFDRMDYGNAVILMEKALKSDDEFVEAHLVLAEIYLENGDNKKAINSYKKSIEINPTFFPGLYYSLGLLEMKENEFIEAKEHFEKYLGFKNLKPALMSMAKKKIETCEFANEAINNPVPFNPLNLGDSINSEFDEYWPSLTADEQTLIFTRLIPIDNEVGIKMIGNKNPVIDLQSVQEDFFISEKENNVWLGAQNIGEPLNTIGNEGAQTVSVDGRTMYFTACNREDGKGRCDIYKCKKENGKWSVPENIGSPVNSKYWEAQPSISPDGKTLFFVSNREGGLGGKDIWISTQNRDGEWSKPINPGKKINSSGDEQSPFIHPDNHTLYFSSNARVGMGSSDLFIASRNDDGVWEEAVNLGYPINTVFDEIGLVVNARGDRALFSSDRLNRKRRDIFEFELYKEARPDPVSYMKGNVYDSEKNTKLQAYFELINLETDSIIMQAESDAITGEFLLCIPSNNDYALNVSKSGYLFYSDNFSLKGIFDISEPYLKDIALNPIKQGEKIILKNVFYETDSYELKQESHTELNRLLAFLVNNKQIKIEISGHTDNVGLHDYNMELSENRAKSVYTFLVNNKINSERLIYKGYGELQPLSSNETKEGRAENRRTEIKILD